MATDTESKEMQVDFVSKNTTSSQVLLGNNLTFSDTLYENVYEYLFVKNMIFSHFLPCPCFFAATR